MFGNIGTFPLTTVFMMKEIGLVMNLKDLGATEDMIEGIADATFILEGGYKVFDRDEVIQVLKESMKA